MEILCLSLTRSVASTLLWFTFFFLYPPSYIITPFSRGANRISSSLETRQGVKARVAGVHCWRKMEWRPSSKREDRSAGGEEGRNNGMHKGGGGGGGGGRFTKKGWWPFGRIPKPYILISARCSPSYMLKYAQTVPFSIYHPSSPSSTSYLVLSFFLLLRSA